MNDAATLAAEDSLGPPKKKRVVPGNWMRNICGQRSACGERVVLRFLAASINFFAISLFLYLILVMGQKRPFMAQQVQTQHKGAKRLVDQPSSGVGRSYPELTDITDSTGVQFEHLSSPEEKFIVESMGGGVAL